MEFEVDSELPPADDDQATPQSRLTRFLNNLSLRPNDPPHDIDDNHLATQPLANATSAMYLSNNMNPEADSFAYMETLLESLAVLGKLGTALDSVAQRVPNEIFNLVESTLDEVEERAEFGRRRSMLSVNGALGRPEGAYVFNTNASMSGVPSAIMKAPLLKSSTLRLNALESLAKRVDHEILLDLFWTVYSKLDAVAQGFRVVTEVANRIGSVGLYSQSCRLRSFLPSVETSKIHRELSPGCYFRCRRCGTMSRLRYIFLSLGNTNLTLAVFRLAL